MKGVCCICRKVIGVETVPRGRVMASFVRSHYGLCPACLGRTRADISRIYGQGGAGGGVRTVPAAAAGRSAA